jgi:hypothetical protein
VTFSYVQAEECCAFFPQWDEDVRIKRAFVTTITTTEEGDEQRSGIRPMAQRSLEYSLQTRGFAETSYLKRRLTRSVNKVWDVPLWTYDMELTAQASAGGSVLNVNSTVHRGLSGENLKVLIRRGYNNYESGEVLSMTGNSITLDKNLDSTWAAGTKVYPLLRSTIGMVVDLEPQTLEHISMSLSFTESFRSEA